MHNSSPAHHLICLMQSFLVPITYLLTYQTAFLRFHPGTAWTRCVAWFYDRRHPLWLSGAILSNEGSSQERGRTPKSWVAVECCIAMLPLKITLLPLKITMLLLKITMLYPLKLRLKTGWCFFLYEGRFLLVSQDLTLALTLTWSNLSVI